MEGRGLERGYEAVNAIGLNHETGQRDPAPPSDIDFRRLVGGKTNPSNSATSAVAPLIGIGPAPARDLLMAGRLVGRYARSEDDNALVAEGEPHRGERRQRQADVGVFRGKGGQARDV